MPIRRCKQSVPHSSNACRTTQHRSWSGTDARAGRAYRATPQNWRGCHHRQSRPRRFRSGAADCQRRRVLTRRRLVTPRQTWPNDTTLRASEHRCAWRAHMSSTRAVCRVSPHSAKHTTPAIPPISLHLPTAVRCAQEPVFPISAPSNGLATM